MKLLHDTITKETAESSYLSVEEMRERFAAFAARVEPAFAASATWPGGELGAQSVGPPDQRGYQRDFRYAAGAFAVELTVVDRQSFVSHNAVAVGLPEGWHLHLLIDVVLDGEYAGTRKHTVFDLPESLAGGLTLP